MNFTKLLLEDFHNIDASNMYLFIFSLLLIGFVIGSLVAAYYGYGRIL